MNSMRRIGICAIGAGLGLAGSLQAASLAPDPVIQLIEKHYNSARTLSVDFVEEYSTQGRRRPAESGTLTLRKQGKMRWDYSKPAGKLFVSDGKMIYLYTAMDNKVEEIPLKDTEDMRAPLAFLLGHLDLKKEFRDFALHPDQASGTSQTKTWLEASAKSAKTPYSKIEMLVDADGEIQKLNVLGRDESRLQFGLDHEQLNPRVSDSLFNFRIPPGAEIVHAVAYTGEDR